MEDMAIDFPGQRGASKNQKVLTKPLIDLFSDFKKLNLANKMPFTTFKRRRPNNILPSSSRKFNQCLCESTERCVNVMLIMDVINPYLDQKSDARLLSEHVTCVEELVRRSLCENMRRDCIEREYDTERWGTNDFLVCVRSKISRDGHVQKEWKQWEKK